MKQLVEKILKSGLVDRHTAKLMEKWGTLDTGAVEMVEGAEQLSRNAFIQFAEDLDQLISEERDSVKETRLGITVGEPFLVRLSNEEKNVVAFMDEIGNFILPATTYDSAVESSSLCVITEGIFWDIESATPLYLGDTMYAVQLKVKEQG